MTARAKCDHCPIRDSEDECPGQRNSRVCQRADTESELYDAAAAEEIRGFHSAAAGNCDPPQFEIVILASPDTIPSDCVDVLPPVAEILANVARMKACRAWQASSSCGCGINVCLEGKGKDGQVSYHDCFACLEAGDKASDG